jgi:predicted RNA-binding protein with PIN domain
MQEFLIDGNNLIHKLPQLVKVQSKDREAARSKLAFLLDRYFSGKKVKAYLHFDGFSERSFGEGERINVSNIKIIYSSNKTADENIRKYIEKSSKRYLITVISSDRSDITGFAKVCGCKIISSEGFASKLQKLNSINEEESIIQSINDVEEFKRLFS